MNSNWGIVPPLPDRVRDKKEKNKQLAIRGLKALNESGIELISRPDPFLINEPEAEPAPT
jgi:hypothetical protein